MAKLPKRRRRRCPLPAQDVAPWTAEGRFEPVTESTQTVVLTWDDLPPEFSFVIAGVQTGPRPGWWEPPPGTALEASWVLYPDDVPPPLRPLIVLTGALALYWVLDDLRLAPTLHWPSQLCIGDRIVGGVRTDAHDLDGPVALGAGIYVGLSRHQIPAGHRGRITSVAIVGSRADRMEIFVRFQDHLRRLYRQLEEDPEVVLASYRAACSTLGRRVRVESHGSPVEGLAVDLDSDGRLVLDTGDRLTGPVAIVGPPRARTALRVCVPILGMSVLSASGVVCTRRLRRALTAGR